MRRGVERLSPLASTSLYFPSTALHCTLPLHCSSSASPLPLHCSPLPATTFHCPSLPSNCPILFCTDLHCSVLFCTDLHCSVLFCTVLHGHLVLCTTYPLLVTTSALHRSSTCNSVVDGAIRLFTAQAQLNECNCNVYPLLILAAVYVLNHCCLLFVWPGCERGHRNAEYARVGTHRKWDIVLFVATNAFFDCCYDWCRYMC